MPMRPSCRPAPAHEAIVGIAPIAPIVSIAPIASVAAIAPIASIASIASTGTGPADFPSPGA